MKKGKAYIILPLFVISIHNTNGKLEFIFLFGWLNKIITIKF
jgi:hypothetical protein